MDHVSRRVLVRACRVWHPSMWVPFVHEQCRCNELVSLRNRVLAACPPFLGDERQFNRVADDFARLIGPAEPLSYEEAFKGFPRAKADRYLREIPKAELGLECRYSTIRAFVKFERLVEWDKDPRMIQFRHPAYSLVLATYLKAIEHKLYRIRGGRFLPPDRCIAKGLNQRDRYSLLKRKLLRFRNPVMIGIDASRWDLHCRAKLLSKEHRVYNKVFGCSRLRKMLVKQLRNKGFTSTQIKYVVDGCRMSGDMNTALGNCILMLMLLCVLLQYIFWDLLDDGDDCIVIVEMEDYERVCDILVRGFLTFGHELKIERVATDLEQIVFCNSMPVFDGRGYKFVRDPHKILGFGVSGSKFIKLGPKAFKNHLLAVGMCELALNVGVPCLQAYACRLLELGRGGKLSEGNVVNVGRLAMAKREVSARCFEDLRKVQPREISVEARESFARSFGIDAQMQLSIEQSMHTVKLDTFSGDVVADLMMWAI